MVAVETITVKRVESEHSKHDQHHKNRNNSGHNSATHNDNDHKQSDHNGGDDNTDDWQLVILVVVKIKIAMMITLINMMLVIFKKGQK